MGSGKTSVGRLLADMTGMGFVDIDLMIENDRGMTIKEIFEDGGEPSFRKLESEAIGHLTDFDNCVVATGGGVLKDLNNLYSMKRSGTVVWLKASPETILKRMSKAEEMEKRPLFDADSFDKLMRERESRYAMADFTVTVDGVGEHQVVDQLIKMLELSLKNSFSPQVQSVVRHVSADSRGYDVVISPELARAFEQTLDMLLRDGTIGSGRRAMVVSSSPVMSLYREDVEEAFEDHHITPVGLTVPDGEDAKSVEVLGRLYEEAALAGLGRDSVAFGLGGGTVGDLTGFFASTYCRGIPVVHVPTTLLSMVDSSVGGKTAVNLRAGKNLAGTFWQPNAVAIGVDTLKTLDIRQLRTGMAEVVKSAVISDKVLFEFLEQELCSSDSDMRLQDLFSDTGKAMYVIEASLNVKAAIVEQDEREKGLRMLLNLGHTLGHAVEKEGGFKMWSHGEAVSIGLAAACMVSVRHDMLDGGDCSRVISLLKSIGLPTDMGIIDDDMFARLDDDMKIDKKAVCNRSRLILPEEIGKCIVSSDYEHAELIAALTDVHGM